MTELRITADSLLRGSTIAAARVIETHGVFPLELLRGDEKCGRRARRNWRRVMSCCCVAIGTRSRRFAGGYRFTDFMKVGIPLIAIFCAISLWLIPHFWPFYP